MTAYTILKSENLPESLRGKPRWVICVVFTAGLLVMIFSAIAAGVFIGYTYCYVEHRTGFRTGNMTQSQDLRIFNVPLGDNADANDKNSINKVLISSPLVQRILKISHTLWDDDHIYLPQLGDEMKLGKIGSELKISHV